MRVRPEPLPATPDRQPYFRVIVADTSITLRTPSLHKVGRILRDIGKEGQGRLAGVVQMASGGAPLLTLLASAPDVLELFAGFIGLAWADPVHELETPARETAELAAYGAEVYEELHEAGWRLQDVALAGMALARQVQADSTINEEVTAQAAFFLRRRAPSSSNGSTSSAPSSAPTSAEASEI